MPLSIGVCGSATLFDEFAGGKLSLIIDEGLRQLWRQISNLLQTQHIRNHSVQKLACFCVVLVALPLLFAAYCLDALGLQPRDLRVYVFHFFHETDLL